MLTPYRLRTATADDAEAVSTLLAALGHPTPAAEVPARLVAVAADGGVVLLAVDAGGRAVGLMGLARHAAVHSPGPIAYITALVTAAEARGRGVGRTMVEAAFAWAREGGCVRLSVTSAERRADAHAFYERCGLPYTGRRFAAALAPPRPAPPAGD